MLRQKMGYIDLYKGGAKCGNMGHVRLEWRDGQYRFDANLCRLDRQTIVTALVERSGQGTATKMKDIPIIHGKGQYQSEWIKVYGNEERLLFEASGGIYGVCVLPRMECAAEDADNLSADALTGRRDGSEDRYAPAKRQEISEDRHAPAKRQEMSEDQAASTKKRDGSEDGLAVIPENASEEARRREKEAIPEVPSEEAHRRREEATMRGGSAPEKEQDISAQEDERNEYEKRISSLSEDKWKQLCRMYEVVHPIDDGIDFIKLAPEDFVILRQEFQGLVRNSFLLHGYYNYNYILLGKYPDKYYIGVPGVMYEQERVAAAMFGFVGFERAKQPQDKNGEDFGYYMMEVGI